MNILVEQLPEAILIDGFEYEINSDFRTCIKIIMAFEDNDLTNYEKQMVMIQLLYKTIPENVQAAMEKAILFLNAGDDSGNQDDGELKIRVYSFDKDSKFIYAAFRQTHGVDLSKSDMHWWEFMTLFLDLGSETTFSNIISLRSKLQSGKATKEERQMAANMKDILDLPQIDTRTIEEKDMESEFLALVRKGKA